MTRLELELRNEQDFVPVDAANARLVLADVFSAGGWREVTLSVAVVNDEEIRRVHREFMAIDEPTDVISFELERQDDALEGEIVASGETASREGARCGWSGREELLLYLVHGALHLAGHDDLEPGARGAMRAAERRHLARIGLAPPWGGVEEGATDDATPAGGRP